MGIRKKLFPTIMISKLLFCFLILLPCCVISQSFGPRKKQCDSEFIKDKDRSIDKFICQETPFLSSFKLDIGPKSKLCFAIACAYRSLGCKEETERVEKLIKDAGGTIGTCTGITDAQCNQAKKLILNEDPPASFTPEDLFKVFSICTPYVAFAKSLAPNLASKFGPCSDFCNQATCALEQLCPTQGAAVVNKLHTKSCASPLDCKTYVPPPTQPPDMSGATAETCAPNLSCTDCVAKPGCGYCQAFTIGMCVPKSTASWEFCPKQFESKDSGTCPTQDHCAPYGACADCIAETGCGYCASPLANLCIPSDFGKYCPNLSGTFAKDSSTCAALPTTTTTKYTGTSPNTPSPNSNNPNTPSSNNPHHSSGCEGCRCGTGNQCNDGLSCDSRNICIAVQQKTKCQLASGSVCSACALQGERCYYCEATRQCLDAPEGRGWNGPYDSTSDNLFPDDSVACPDWQFEQCWIAGKTLILLIGGLSIAVFVCCCCGVIACYCKVRRRRRKNAGYSLQLDDSDEEATALMLRDEIADDSD